MKLGNIQIPWKLVDSIEDDRLVIFVGAGASVDPPSGLPLFNKLASLIADGSLKRDPADEPFDRYLGRVDQKPEIQVHRRAAQLLSGPNTQPNALHGLIVDLFKEPGKIRVVTTNFDLHLESALRNSFGDSSVACEIFKAPALPTGSNFRGIVYLHGCLCPDPARMVLTDRDFGRAYLTEGWARRFLVELFQSYDVLFIGYSHSDQIVSYLARGLPPETKRIRAALTKAGDTDRWKLLGIKPLEYSPENHGEAKETLVQWHRLRSLAASDHEAEIREIVARPLQLLPHESDRLLWIIRGSRYRHFFFNQATQPEWLEWANSKDLLEPLFDPASEDRETSDWFTEDPISVRGDTAIVILLQHSRKKLAYATWRKLAHRIWVSVENSEEDLQADEHRRLVQWVSILRLQAEPGWNWDMHDYLVGALKLSEADLLLELLDALTEPHLVPTDRYRAFQAKSTPWSSELSYRMPSSAYGARKAWKKTVIPNMERFAIPVISLVQTQVERSFRLLSAVGQASSRFDPQSYRHTTIEESDQPKHPDDAIDFLVEAGRDALEWLVVHRPKKGRSVIESWLESDALLLQRLALHGAARHLTLSPVQMAQYLLANGRINNHQLHHEVFGVLRGLYPGLNSTWRKRLLTAKRRLLKAEYAEEENDDKDQARTRRSYEWFCFLAWLNRADPDCEVAKPELDQVHTQYPDFEVDKRPDLKFYLEEVQHVDLGEPLSTDEMLELAPGEVYSRYKQLAKADRHDLRNQVLGFSKVLNKAVQKKNEWSLSLGKHLLDHARTDAREAQDLLGSLIRGWQESDLESEDWCRVVAFLKSQELSEAIQRDVVELLQRRFEAKAGGLDCSAIQETLGLALELHKGLRAVAEEFIDSRDPVLKAINQPGGKLALFAVSALSRAVKLDCSSPKDLPRLWELLDSLTNDAENGRLHGLVVLAGQLHFMLYANQVWVSERLLPLFKWETGVRAAHLWSGFFFWGRLTGPAVESILPLFPDLFHHLEELPERVRERVSEYIAHIVVVPAPESPIQESWFKDYLRLSSDGDRQSFAGQMERILSELWEEKDKDGVETGDALWTRLLADYLDARLAAETISEREWSAVAPWCLYLDSCIPEFVGRFVRGPEPSDHHTSIFHQLQETEHVYDHPDEIARLVAHLLGGQRRGEIWGLNAVRRIVERLRGANASSELIEAVKNKALELGALSKLFDDEK